MNSLMSLWKVLAMDLASMCCTCAIRDIKTVTDRYEYEGKSFLTITLPTFSKDLERALDQGSVDRTMFVSFNKHGCLPRFLGGFTDQIFDRSTGVLLDEPNIDAIYAIRQLTLVFGKMFLLSNAKRERQAMDKFIECENDVKRISDILQESFKDDLKRVSKLLFHDIFQTIDWKIFDLDLNGKHGPGATADGFSGNGKYTCSSWTRRLETVLPFGDMLLVNRSYRSIGDAIDIIEPEAEIPVKVISVPKTQKTPRIIAIEPTCMQFAQQAVSALIVKAIERHPLLSSLIGFSDQVPNQELARDGSLSGDLATLDLSEASDRVSNSLVNLLVEDYPCLSRAVSACRSYRAKVPGHGVITLNKYASMGSALTFPIEAMVFLTVVFIGIERELSTPLSSDDLEDHRWWVRIYGDDIVVPVDTVRSVVDSLESFGFVVNHAKSFWTGRFRESCGKDYYNGHDITVVKLRQNIPSQRKHATETIALVSFRNQLYQRGLWKTCAWLDERIRAILKYFPVVLPTSPVIGRHSFLGYETEKLCPVLHRPLVKGHVVRAQSPISQIGGHAALFKCLFRHGTLPSIDGHLTRAGRPRAVGTKTRWAPPH
jgi:hypothetical protein